jgi:hypothetical protein
MRYTSLVAFIAAAVAPQALAVLDVTSPVATTTCSGGAVCQVAWQDDGTAPTLAAMGASSVSVYTGNQQQQTLLQLITASVDVSTTAALEFTVDPTIGPDGDFYFIRFSSIALKDPTNAAIPFLSFSHIFTLDDMTGVFNATVQAEVNALTQSVAAAPTTPVVTTPHVSTPAATHASTASAAKSSTTSKSNGATKMGAAGFAVGASALLGLLL